MSIFILATDFANAAEIAKEVSRDFDFFAAAREEIVRGQEMTGARCKRARWCKESPATREGELLARTFNNQTGWSKCRDA